MKTLITGFEPFDGMDMNPSEVVALELGKLKEDRKTAILPVTFSHSFEVLKREIETYKPDRVVAIGHSGLAEKILLEHAALNYINARIPDNLGEQPKDMSIVENGANAYFSNLPIQEWRDAIEKMYVPAELSYSAGAFVCNFIFYKIQEYFKNTEVKSGFIHIPSFDIISQEKIIKVLDSVLG
jgi:pyroglutamyl-peptidase